MSYAGYGGYVWKIEIDNTNSVRVIPRPDRCDVVPFNEKEYERGYEAVLLNIRESRKLSYHHISIGDDDKRMTLFKTTAEFISNNEVEEIQTPWEKNTEDCFAACWEVNGTNLKGMHIAQRIGTKTIAYLAIGGHNFGSGVESGVVLNIIIRAAFSFIWLKPLYRFLLRIASRWTRFRLSIAYKYGTYLIKDTLKLWPDRLNENLDDIYWRIRFVSYNYSIGVSGSGKANLRHKLRRTKYRFMLWLWNMISGLSSVRKRTMEYKGFWM